MIQVEAHLYPLMFLYPEETSANTPLHHRMQRLVAILAPLHWRWESGQDWVTSLTHQPPTVSQAYMLLMCLVTCRWGEKEIVACLDPVLNSSLRSDPDEVGANRLVGQEPGAVMQEIPETTCPNSELALSSHP